MKRRRISVSENYKTLFDDWEIAIAVRQVKRSRSEGSLLGREDFEDLLQECLSHWFFKRDKYTPSRGANRRTFMAAVISKKLMELGEKAGTNMRKASFVAESLDRPLGDDEDSETPYDLIDPATIPDMPADPITFVLLEVDLAKITSHMSPQQRDLYRFRMSGMSSKETMEALGIKKDEYYAELKRIQKLFEKEGLRESLK
jgi:DNA-directed RNA polymerase specialized sigma24 family protein